MQKEVIVRNSKVCCISDLHIGVHQNSSFWHETALKWAVWLKTELQEKDIEDIFILGDLYHYRDEIAVNTIHVVNEILKIWKDFNICILVGNHDSFYKDRTDVNSLSILHGWDNINVISEVCTVMIHGKKCTFLPWNSELNKIGKSDIIFGHLEIESFKMNSYKLCEEGMKSKDLLKHARFIFSGHFHLRDERKYDEGKIIYLGNPFEMDFGDAGSSKGYHILDFKDISYEFFENNVSPKHKKLLLSDVLNNESLETDNIKTALNRNIVKLVIDKKMSSENIDSLIKKLTLHKPQSLSVDYSLAVDKLNVAEENKYDLGGIDITQAISEFINLLEIEEKESVTKYCTDLYLKCK